MLDLSDMWREQEPPSHLLTIILKLARLGTSELRWWFIVLPSVSRYSQPHKLFILMFSVHLLSERCALPPMGNAPLPLVVNVPPAGDEQVAHVFKNRKTGKEMCTGWMTVYLQWHNNRESNTQYCLRNRH